MATNENVEKAKVAIEAANTNLRDREDQAAIAVALMGIGHALIAIAEEVRAAR